MNLDEIKELIGLMRKHRISEIDLEQEGSKVRIVAEPARQTASAVTAAPQQMPTPYYLASPMEAMRMPAPEAAAPAAAPAAEAAPVVAKQEAISTTAVEVKSPMVGTFYRAPAPDAPAYVEEGSVIHKETVICIIEAMKLMNEIKAETSGRIVKILVSNGQPVEYNQPLFLVEP